ncbi:MAG: outer membrane lipoprotein-sorting protein [Albidovulum sp.]|nr:outer membrane lipoprotein-sorting protein [Albidovulum sp.]
MKTHLHIAAILLTLAPWAALSADAPTGLEIMRQVNARDDGDNRIAQISMTLIDRNGHQRQRQLVSYNKDRGRAVLQLLFFLDPPNVRNTGFLTYDYQDPGRDNDQWLYLPELYKTKRIAGSDKSQSFMGSDFSYADLNRQVLDEWKFKLLGERDVRGNKAWLVEATPVSEDVEQRYGYSKSVLFVRSDLNMVVRAVHWLAGGNRLKYLDIVNLQKIDGIWTATELDMRTVQAKETLHRTVMKFRNVRYNQNLDESIFTQRRLEKGL